MDLRCTVAWHDGAFYHQIIDCLMPFVAYAYAARQLGGAVCASPGAARWLRTFRVRVVDPCPREYHAPPHLASGPIATASLVDALTRDVAPASCDDARVVVLVRRHGTRAFTPDSFRRLHRALARVAPVRVFEGNESVVDVARAFVYARAIVGYHGAGFANAVFSRCNATLVEVSTYSDEANARLWRSNIASLRRWRQFGQTHTLHLPLQQVLRANGDIPYRHHDPDHFVKNLRNVSLTDSDAWQIAAWVRSGIVAG